MNLAPKSKSHARFSTFTMNTNSPILTILTIAFLLAGQSAYAKPDGVSYAGGDGSSIEKAVVIKGATEETGVRAEYAYIEKHYPGYKRGGQSLQSVKGRSYDAIDITTSDGKKKTVYFDITQFFGK